MLSDEKRVGLIAKSLNYEYTCESANGFELISCTNYDDPLKALNDAFLESLKGQIFNMEDPTVLTCYNSGRILLLNWAANFMLNLKHDVRGESHAGLFKDSKAYFQLLSQLEQGGEMHAKILDILVLGKKTISCLVGLQLIQLPNSLVVMTVFQCLTPEPFSRATSKS